jgi:hypothetical protein
VHDFDPGITPYPDGLFWTVPLVAPDGVDVQMGAGRARMTANNLKLLDYFDIPNALFHFEDPLSAPVTCSFDIHWTGPVTDRSPITTTGSTGQLVSTSATMTWSAENELGFKFVSDPSPTTSVLAQVGRVANGVFADST